MIIHQVNTKIWNLASEPSVCEMLERSARVVDQSAGAFLHNSQA